MRKLVPAAKCRLLAHISTRGNWAIGGGSQLRVFRSLERKTVRPPLYTNIRILNICLRFQPVKLLAKLNNAFLQSDNLSVMDVSVHVQPVWISRKYFPPSSHANVIPSHPEFNGYRDTQRLLTLNFAKPNNSWNWRSQLKERVDRTYIDYRKIKPNVFSILYSLQ